MKKLIIAMCLVIIAAASVSAGDLLAPVYPGAVPLGGGKTGCFLSKAPFDKVLAWYKNDRGKISEKTDSGELGRFAFFEYMDVRQVHQYDPVGSAMGVCLYGRNLANETDTVETAWPHVGDVFGQLKGLVMLGSLSESDYQNLVDRYQPLAACYFPLSDQNDHNGERLPLDEAIIDRYDTGPEEKQLEQDAEAMAQKVQQLMMQGRQKEALALMQKMGKAAERQHVRSTGTPEIDKWKACLRELERNAYPTRIEIHSHPGGRQ